MWKDTTQEVIDSLVITEPTDFVIVGSAKTEEDGEETQPNEHDSPKGTPTSIDDDEGEDDSHQEWTDDPTQDSVEQWFSLCIQEGCIRGFLSPGIPRVGHTRYADSWRGYAERAKEASQ